MTFGLRCEDTGAVVNPPVEWDHVKADSDDNTSLTPLSYATARGCDVVVRLLVERDDADSKDNFGRMLLSFAGHGVHKAVTRLRGRTSRPTRKAMANRMSLSWEAGKGYEAEIRFC